MQNSAIFHATSPTPFGPYVTDGDAVFPPEAHEPIVARAPTGEYIMWFTSGAHGPGGARPVVGGASCDCATPEGIAACPWQAAIRRRGDLPTYMSYAREPYGPWSKPRPMTAVNDATGAADSNFAGLVQPDGSVVAVGRTHAYHCRHWNDTESCIATAVPHSGNGQPGTRGGMAGEDPFLWFDARNANLTKVPVLHMLRHVGRDTSVWAGNNGGHQFSLDLGLSWSDCVDGCTTAYPCHAEFTDGSSRCFMMRERPHLVFAADGYSPLALTNGAAPGPDTCTGATRCAGNDYSFTLLQRLQQ